MRAEAAVAPLLALLKLIEGDEAADLELPVVFGMIGPAAIPDIAAFMANGENPESSVATAISGLSQIVARHAGCRGECVAILVRTLEPHADINPTINGFAVSALLDLRAVEAIDTIRDAFRQDAVDLSIAGDIEDVEIELGLRDRRATPAPRYPLLLADWPPWSGVDPVQRDRPVPARREKLGGTSHPAPAAAVRSTRNAACNKRGRLHPREARSAMTTKSTKVRKGWEGLFAALTGLTDRFCDEHLDREYAEMARYAIAALCRKRPSPLTSGHQQTWACAVLYALGQINFLHDKSSTPYMAMADLCGHFGIAPSTGGNKAKLVRKALAMHPFDHNWTLPSRLASSSLAWLIEVDGLVVDARQLPAAVQAVAVLKGLIPFVYPPPGQAAIEPA